MAAPRMAPRLAELEEACRRRGLAVTIQRRAVFGELAGRRDHPTADQVYDAVRMPLPGLSRTTLYRVRETLVDAGLARKVQHAGGVARLERISMCGYLPATVMLIASKILGATSARLVRYMTSGDVSGDYESVVGYAGVVLTA